MIAEDGWTSSARPRIGWHHDNLLIAGPLVVVTTESRLVLTKYATLSVTSRRADVRPALPPKLVTVIGFEDITLGEPWIYRYLDDDLITENVTGPVEEIWEVVGDWVAPGIGLSIEEGSVRRTCEQELWVESIGSGVTLLIQTIGSWDGTWVLTSDGSRFVPTDAEALVRSWDAVMPLSWMRMGETLWLDRRVAPGIWARIDAAGCGTVTRIVVEQVDLPD